MVNTAVAHLDYMFYCFSQVLVLPPYQKQGHGATLIETFYKECLSRKEVLDITGK